MYFSLLSLERCAGESSRASACLACDVRNVVAFVHFIARIEPWPWCSLDGTGECARLCWTGQARQ